MMLLAIFFSLTIFSLSLFLYSKNQFKCVFVNLAVCFMQLSLTIIYIAGGVFAAGWIGKV